MKFSSLRKHFLTILGAFLLTLVVFQSPMNGYYKAEFGSTIEGSAHRPFAYRVLLPFIIRSTSKVLSSDFERCLVEIGQQNVVIQNLINFNRIPEDLIPELMIFIILCFFSLYGFLLITSQLIAHFYPDIPNSETYLYVLGAVGASAISWGHYVYIYDVALWFTFALATLFMFQRRWGLFLIAFVICTLNKESSLLLLPILYLQTKEQETRKFCYKIVASSFLIWILTFGLIRYNYRHNPGEFLEFHLFNQWHDPVVGDMQASFILCIPFWLLLIVPNWKSKPLILRQGLIYTFAPLMVLMLFFGYIYEIRDYYESLIFAYLLCVPTIHAIHQWFLKLKIKNVREQSMPPAAFD